MWAFLSDEVIFGPIFLFHWPSSEMQLYLLRKGINKNEIVIIVNRSLFSFNEIWH